MKELSTLNFNRKFKLLIEENIDGEEDKKI